MSTRRTSRVVRRLNIDPLAAAVAEPANPATETGEAYADRQMAAYGVEPSRWALDVLANAYGHLLMSGTYLEHAARIGAELDLRGPPDAALLALCAQLDDMHAEWQRLYDATSDADELTTPADHAWRAYSDDVWPHTALQPKGSTAPDVPALLLTHPATTLEGLQAKSAAILAINAAADYCDLRDDGLDLALSLARDAAGIAFCPVGAEAAQSITPLRPVPHGT